MNIIKNLIEESKYALKCPHSMSPSRLVIHNTANNASAMNEINYMKSNDLQVSFHFAVDDLQVVQGIPLDRNAWHAGDGAEGLGNRFGIAIEICYSKDDADLNKFIIAEQNAAKLAAYLILEYHWDINALTKHQDYSGKYCPHRTLDMGWDRFINLVKENIEFIEGNGEPKMITQELTTLTLTRSTINGNQYRTRSSIMGPIMDSAYFAIVGETYALLEVTETVQSDGYLWGKIVVLDKIVFIQMDMEYMFKTNPSGNDQYTLVTESLYRKEI